jgi:hypothetical protein
VTDIRTAVGTVDHSRPNPPARPPDHPEDTMPATARPARTPATAPAYYLGRPASVWIRVLTRPATAAR